MDALKDSIDYSQHTVLASVFCFARFDHKFQALATKINKVYETFYIRMRINTHNVLMIFKMRQCLSETVVEMTWHSTNIVAYIHRMIAGRNA